MKKLLIVISLLLTSTMASALSIEGWALTKFEDGMTGDISKELRVEGTLNKELAFPYANPLVILSYSCKGDFFALYTEASNITGGDLEDGYSQFRFRIKIDDNLTASNFLQTWGSNWFQLSAHGTSNSIKSSNKLLIETPLYGDGNVVYSFNTLNFKNFKTNNC